MASLPPFLEALAAGPLVFDGAMGTQLYERGGALNKCFDELSLSAPQVVAEVHRDYLEVGCDVVQANSYGANRFALAPHGLAERVGDICAAAARIAREVAKDRAWVAGSVGPSGLLPKDLIRNKTRRLAFDAFREQAQALVEHGCDLLSFETFGYLGELEIAVEAAYGLNVPIVAQCTFDEQNRTQDGAAPDEVVERMIGLGVDVVGANCSLGPERLLSVVELMVGKGRPVVMQPNAGYPRVVDGRSIYLSSPETYGVVARRAFKAGVAAVGGCCGTGPDHIRRVVAAARMLGGGRWRRQALHARPRDRVEGEAPTPLAERSAFGKKLADGKFVVSVEVSPPTGLDPSAALDKIRLLDDAGIDVVNIPDGPRATVRMSNQAFARRVLERCTKVEPLLHVCGRDRNLLGLQADLIGAHVNGLKNLLIITGDPPKVGDYPDATAVFDLDSIGLLGLARGLNRGVDPAGKPMGEKTAFVLGTGAEPAARDFEREIKRLFEKKEAGAELVLTQPVFDLATLDRFLTATKALGLPILVGVLPLASARNAEFLQANVPGMHIPDAVLERLRRAGDGAHATREGVAIAAEALAAVKGRVQGAYLMPPFGRVELALEVLARC
ncbi:MAG: bifunctional homocysteine S-methyltransferase/methylenetetrahydrofolate reductase [Deltaproteobacteria bacterium]|nr:bifunctional homocysteine S-methyltransferase/methylenetetrahydrofolate reductase [Deltaproteobacteria bacterium]